LTEFELALEILRTCSNSIQDSSKKSRKHLEEQKLEEEINSKLIQLKTRKRQHHRFNRRLGVGATKRAPVTPMPCLQSNSSTLMDSSFENIFYNR